jgi:hypothetical protein
VMNRFVTPSNRMAEGGGVSIFYFFWLFQ